MWVTKLLISPVKKDFLPQNDQIWPKIGIFGQLCALMVSRLVVVARGLYLARHLFTLLFNDQLTKRTWQPKLGFEVAEDSAARLAATLFVSSQPKFRELLTC